MFQRNCVIFRRKYRNKNVFLKADYEIVISGFCRGVNETSIFWDVRQHMFVFNYQSVRIIYRSDLQRPETNYQSTLHNILEERRSLLVQHSFLLYIPS